MDALLELGSLSDQRHPCLGKLLLVPKFTGWDPYGGKRSSSLEFIEASCIKLISLVDHVHHKFRLGGLDQPENTNRLFDLLHNPAPVSHGFHSHWTSRVAGFEGQHCQGFALMNYLSFPVHPALLVLYYRIRLLLVTVKGDILLCAHPPFFSGRITLP